MKKILFAFLFLIAGSVLAQDIETLYRQGNELYAKSKYDSAASYYSKIIYTGISSPEIYFNLGNCYFKTKKTAPAILNYEKAAKLSPNDEDIQFNLSLANLSVVDKITPVPHIFYERWWKTAVNFFPADSWGIYSIFLAWMTFLCAGFFILIGNTGIKKFLFFFGLFTLLLSSLFFFAGQKQNENSVTEGEAVIFDNSVYIKSSPDEKGMDLFILHEGVKVSILDEIGEWRKIRIANGSEGWVKKEAIETI